MNPKQQEIFEKVKGYDLRNFIEELGFETKKGKNSECPFCGKKNFSIKDRDQYFRCFSTSCDKAGDIVNFAKFHYKLDSNLEAAKKILEFYNDSFGDSAKKESKKQLEARRKELERKRQAEEQQRQKDRLNAMAKNKANAEKYKKNVPYHLEEVRKVFPQFGNKKCNTFLYKYIGYNPDHQSICILCNDGHDFHNIKHRTMRDKEGKWISSFNSTTFPFPLELHYESIENFVFLCEGEKDVLNLWTIGIPALTLGGVVNSWDKYHMFLKDKRVYIFFDHDEAGYIGAIKRYNELKEHVKEIYVVLLFQLMGSECPKGYDVSDFLIDHQLLPIDNPKISLFHSDTGLEPFQKIFWQKIKYSTFRMNQKTLTEIADFLNMKKEVRVGYGILNKKATLHTIWNKWREHIVIPKSEYDTSLEERSKGLLKTISGTQDKELLKAVKELVNIKSEMFRVYSKMHRVDLWKAFIQMVNNSQFVLYKDISTLYVWNGKVFQKLTYDDFFFFVGRYWFDAAQVQQKSHTSQTANYLLDDVSMVLNRIDVEKSAKTVRAYTMNNGTFLINHKGRTHFKTDFSPTHLSTTLLDFDYSPDAKCPKWEAMLNRVLPDLDEQKGLQEFFGYCLLPNHNFETFLFLYGDKGANGKSVVLNVLSSFFGVDNVSYLQMQSLKGHELHGLKDKILNIGSEVDGVGNSEAMQNLKSLTSSTDLLSINPKNKETYTLKKECQPKFAFAGNKKPSQGMDNGVFRRMLMINFELQIPEEERIYNISDCFIDEMDGIFIWALDGMKRLIKQKHFTKSQKMRTEIEEYKDEQNPMRVFVRECIISEPDATTTKANLYKYYQEWASKSGRQPLSNTRFFSQFKAECKTNNIPVAEIRGHGTARSIKGVITIDAY